MGENMADKPRGDIVGNAAQPPRLDWNVIASLPRARLLLERATYWLGCATFFVGISLRILSIRSSENRNSTKSFVSGF